MSDQSLKRHHFPRLAWGITGSGHFVQECLDLMKRVPHLDLFLSKAGAEVIRQYKKDLTGFAEDCRIFHDNSASAVPVGNLYKAQYHTVIVAPATSNTVAKAVYGISDTLVTNVYAQAGKCRVPSIVFACDTAPVMETEAPDGWVKVYPRPIDLENAARLKAMDYTSVAETYPDFLKLLEARMEAVGQPLMPQ